MGRKNSELKVKKRRIVGFRNRQGIVIAIFSITFATFLAVTILITIFRPDLLDRIVEHSADFCKVTLGAVLGWLLHKGRGP